MYCGCFSNWYGQVYGYIMHTKYSITGLLTKDPTKVELENIGNELRLAFSEIGFVYLSGHSIAEIEIEK